MSYEAGEALLWERQNARAHTHLAAQMKDLQAQHAAYESRIAATEAIAEAAEAAVHLVKQLDAKVRAIEEEEGDRPFERWAKEAVGQLQVMVDGLKGVRGKICGVEMKVDRLEEVVEGVRGEGEVLRGVLKRLEALEGERRGENGETQGGAGRQPDVIDEDVHEEAYDEVLADDNPLAVFYGIETQSPARRHESPSRGQQSGQQSPSKRYETTSRQKDNVGKNNDACHQSRPARKSTQSPHRHHELTYDLQPPDENITLPEADDSDPLGAAPEVQSGFENTQQFKSMQKELKVLRAMCRSQDTKNSNDTAEATQRPQETIIVPREDRLGFSDATTETEAELPDTRPSLSRMGASGGQVDVLR